MTYGRHNACMGRVGRDPIYRKRSKLMKGSVQRLISIAVVGQIADHAAPKDSQESVTLETRRVNESRRHI